MVALMSMPVLSGAASKKAISSSELNQRVAVIKRFKELLKAQRDRFRAYLDALDKQKDAIENGSPDDLLHHVELEEKIVADIFSIQKVIEPLEEMYHAVIPEFSKGGGLKPSLHSPAGKVSGGEPRISDAALSGPAAGSSSEAEVSGLKEALESLKAEAVIRSELNRALLSKRMAELRSEIKSLRSNAYARGRSGFDASPSHIDLKG